MMWVIALQGTSRDDLVVAVHLRKEYKKEKKDKKKKKKGGKGKDKKKEKEKKAKEDSKGKRSKTIAVEDLSLGLTPGECFGLLGPK
jgi:ABC-type polysaccharide/polyol phosphate transport system ATPase subunit